MAWLKRKVQGHLDSFRGERKSSSTDRVNVDVKIRGPDDELHLSDLESSISSSQGDFRTLIKQQKEAEEAEEARKSKVTSKLKVKGHRRGRSDGTIFIKDKHARRASDNVFNVTNNLLQQMSTSSGSLEYQGSHGHISSAPLSPAPPPIPARREFTNMSFLSEPDDDENAELRRRLEAWKKHNVTLERNYEQMKKGVEERREMLVAMVTEYANEILEKVDKKYTEQKNHADQSIGELETALAAADSSSGSQNILNDQLAGVTTTTLTPPQSVPLPQLTQHTQETLSQSVSQLFGNFQTIQARRSSAAPSTSTGGGMVTEDVNKRRSGGSGENNNNNEEEEDSSSPFMSRPQYLGTISAKTSKDARECGLTDVAFCVKDKQVIVVDKHNKLVKVLDTEGKLVRYIGRNILKEPSRVSLLPWSERILVTDSGAQEVKLFTLDGAMVCSVASDLSAPSGHCAIPATCQIAVINFDTKLVTVYEEEDTIVTQPEKGGGVGDNGGGAGFKKLHSFPTGLDCPAYITHTHKNHLVISDWSANRFRIYNSAGKFLKQINKAGQGQGQVSKPQGVHGDCHGNLFLGEKGNRRIQIFNEEGESTFVMDRKTYDLNLPMALDTTEDGYLIVAEYQGAIKFFRYLDLPDAAVAMTVGPKPKGRATSVVSPEVIVTASESVL